MSSQTFATAAEREALLIDNLPTVRFVARRIHDRLPASVELDDLVSAGSIGLLDAIQKFDESKGVQFRTYAQFRIKGAILDSLRELDWGPRALRRRARQIEEAVNKLRTKLGRAATEHEVTQDLGLSLADYQIILGDLRGLEIGSLHAPDEDAGEVLDFSETLADPGESPFQQYVGVEQKKLLAQWISELPEKEKLVLSLYYYEELPMKEIGSLLGVVESRVSQLHTAAVLKLRARASQSAKAELIPPPVRRGQRLEAAH